jgi:hypothetical protein
MSGWRARRRSARCGRSGHLPATSRPGLRGILAPPAPPMLGLDPGGSECWLYRCCRCGELYPGERMDAVVDYLLGSGSSGSHLAWLWNGGEELMQ